YQIVRGSIERGEFVDYCFRATTGQVYDFMTCAPGSATFASALEIRTSPETGTVFTNPVACGSQTRGSWPAYAPSGEYRLRVRGSQLRDGGDFELAYRWGTPVSASCVELAPTSSYRTTGGSLPGAGSKTYCFDAEANDLFEFSTCPPEGSASFAGYM